MMSIRTTFPLLGLLVALAGCSGESGAAPSATNATTAQAEATPATAQASVANPGHGDFHRFHGGQEFLLRAALHEPSLNLTAAQKTTLEGALADSAPKTPATFDRTRIVALAAGVRAGKIDPASLPAPATNATNGADAHRAAAAKAVDTLHATLTADQRRALVDAVTKRMAEHGAGTDHDHARNGKGPRPGMERMGGEPGDRGPMGGLLAGLDLTKAQEDAIHAKLEAARPAPPSDAERAAMKAQHEAFKADMQARLQTFVSDTFDANAFVAPPAGAVQGPKDHADHMATELAIITSVLDPAQREKLATRLEQGPPARANVVPSPATIQNGASH